MKYAPQARHVSCAGDTKENDQKQVPEVRASIIARCVKPRASCVKTSIACFDLCKVTRFNLPRTPWGKDMDDLADDEEEQLTRHLELDSARRLQHRIWANGAQRLLVKKG
jgi:hypothetical protein